MNIIRVKLPTGTIRLSPFKVKDYINFLLVRKEVEENPLEATQILDELLEDLYPNYPKLYRPYIFITVFAVSIGKSVLPVQYKCPICKSVKKYPLNLMLNKLETPKLKVSNITIEFSFIDFKTDDVYELFDECAKTVSDGETTINWKDLSDIQKDQVLSIISIKEFESVLDKIFPVSIELDLTCCESTKVKYTNFEDIFKLMISDEELIMMYQINHAMTSHNYSLSEILNMTPMERTITLALIEKDLKAKSKG